VGVLHEQAIDPEIPADVPGNVDVAPGIQGDPPGLTVSFVESVGYPCDQTMFPDLSYLMVRAS